MLRDAVRDDSTGEVREMNLRQRSVWVKPRCIIFSLLLAMVAMPNAVKAQPANDSCQNAAIIPGNVVHYNPPVLSVSSALTNLCSPAHSCGSGTFSKDVFYSYTPDLAGRVRVDTFGSNYDTVLSAFDGCRGFCGGISCCPNPDEFACSDNYIFNSQSQINFDVEAGQTYIFRVSALNASGGELLDFDLRWSPPNDVCASATSISGLVYNSPLYSTVNTDVDTCEAQESCELNNVGTSNSVWYSYTPTCDGLLTLDTEGSDYDTVLSVFDGCGVFNGVDIPCGIPDELACDDDAGTGTLSRILQMPVTGGVEYLIKVADYNPALSGGNLKFNLVFEGADPPQAEIAIPSAYDCACAQLPILGTANQAAGTLASWSLDYMPVGGTSWTLIATDSVPVIDELFANWDTGGLAQGNYLLRLSVTNACGLTSTAVQFVYVDVAFSNLDLTSPNNIVVGGNVCPHGTAWDVCFEDFSVDYAPSGSSSYQPVIASMPYYTTAITNDPLLGGQVWNTLAPAVPDGEYNLRLSGATTCGFIAEDITSITIDNTQPVAVIDSPIDCSTVDGAVVITGTANDANLDKWVLQYSSGGGWVEIDSDNVPVVNNVLGVWDTAGLADCSYLLRLLVTDTAVVNCNGAIHHTSEDTVGVLLGDCGDFDFDNDGDVDLIDYAAFEQAYTGPLP